MLPALEERGTIYLFALAEREDLPRWDVVLSSEWSDKDLQGAVRLVVELLRPRLDPDELTMISRVAVIPSSDPNMQVLPASLSHVVPADEKVVYVSLLGSDVRRAFIFKGQHPPTVLAENLLAEATVA